MGVSICIVSDERYPFSGTDTQQVAKTVAALAACGAEVELLVPRRWRSLLQSGQTRRAAYEAFYNVKGPFRIRELLSAPTSLRGLVKPLHQLLGPAHAAMRGKEIVLYTRNLGTVAAGLLLGIELLFDTYRPLPDQHPFLGPVLRGFARHPRFLGVTTHSAFARESFLRAGLDPRSVAAIHNGFDPADLQPRLARQQARQRLGLSVKGLLGVYAGHVRPDKGIGTLIEAAASCPDLDLLLVGATEQEEAWVQREARARRATRVSCVSWVPPDRLCAYLYAADLLLIPPTAGPLESKGNTVLPMKVFNYLAAGRAILGPALPDTAEVLRHERNALLVPPEDPRAMAEALSRLTRDRDLVERLGRAALEDSQRYTWKKRARRLLSFIEERRASPGPEPAPKAPAPRDGGSP